jgi:hypothetical protein
MTPQQRRNLKFLCDCGAGAASKTEWWAHQSSCPNGRGKPLEQFWLYKPKPWRNGTVSAQALRSEGRLPSNHDRAHMLKRIRAWGRTTLLDRDYLQQRRAR